MRVDQHALYQDVGRRLKVLREQRHMSALELAKRLGCETAGTVFAMEAGTSRMLLFRLYELASILQVEVWDLCPLFMPERADGAWYLDGEAWERSL
jgi:transcriptional regulator with XRE-family HTH domain